MIDTPKIPENLTERRFTDIFYEEVPEFEMCMITDSEFTDEALDRLRLYKTVIRNCNFTNTDFSRIDLTDVRFENCDLSNANLGNASMNRVEFLNCKLLGCFAPVNVFIDIFKNAGIEVTMEEAREPMGMLKIDHIRAMLSILFLLVRIMGKYIV